MESGRVADGLGLHEPTEMAVARADGLGEHAAARYRQLRLAVESLAADALDVALFGLLLSAESMRDEMSAFEAQPSALLRLAQTGHYVRQLQRLQGVLDAARGNLTSEEEPPGLAEWEAALEHERDVRMDHYDAMFTGGLGDHGWHEELAAEEMQEEVLVLLKAGEERYGDVLTTRELEVTRRVFQTVAELSGLVAVETPEWFAMPFDFGGTFGLSRWGNDLLVPSQSDRARFVRDVAVWSDLNHPHVAKFLGACHVGVQPFIAHEQVRPLAEYVASVHDRSLVWRQMYETALGLQYLSQRGLTCARLDVDSVYVAQFEDKALLLGVNLLEVESSPRNGAQSDIGLSEDSAALTATFRSLALLIVNVLRSVVAPSRVSSSRNLQVGGSATTGTASGDDALDVVPTDRPLYVTEAEWELVQELWSMENVSSGGMMLALKRLSGFAGLAEQREWLDESGLLESSPTLRDGVTHIGEIVIPALRFAIDETLAQCEAMANVMPLANPIQSRLTDVYNQLEQQMGDLQAGALWLVEPIAHFSSVLVRYYRLLQQMTGSNSSSRVGIARRVPTSVLALHLDIDQLLSVHRLSKGNVVHTWKPAWSTSSSSFQSSSSSFLSLSSHGAPSMVIKADEAAAYSEFEASIACRRPRTPGSSDFELKVDTDLAKSSALPKWFVPPYEVDFKAFDAFSQGSFGSVHHGKWFETPVVVKRVFVDASTYSTVQAQFCHEADVWFKLNHINIVKMYGGCHVGQPFFLCEYASGGDLDSYINHKGRDPYLMWYTLLNAALGLQYLHDAGVAHGDLKANNILVGADNVAKLADFGLSVRTRRSDSSSSGGAVGAFRWKAPECIPSRGSPGQPATFASDVYSFAMCIIQIVSGDYPWGSVPDAAVSFHVKKGRMPLQPDGIADAEWRLIEHMCCLDPTQRVTVDAVVVHLSSLVERLDVAQLWRSVRGEQPRKTYKNRVMSRGGALLSLLSLVKSKNAALANHATSHLFTVHINRGARSERREVVAIVKMLEHGSSTERAWATDALTKLSWKNQANSVLIAEAGGVQVLVSRLLGEDDEEKASAAEALTNLAMVSDIGEQIADAGAIPVLVELVESGEDKQREMAASLLWHLCIKAVNQAAAAAAGAIGPLVTLVNTGKDAQRAKAAGALWNLAAHPDNRRLIVDAGGVSSLKELAGAGTEDQKTNAVAALANLSLDRDCRHVIAAVGGIGFLVDLLGHDNGAVKASAATALWSLFMDPDLRGDVAGAGVVAPFIALVREGDNDLRAKAMDVLLLLSDSRDSSAALVDAGGVDAAMAVLRDGSGAVQTRGLATLLNLSTAPENHALISGKKGLEPLMTLIADGDDTQRELAAGILRNLSVDAELHPSLADAGAVSLLVELVRNGNDAQQDNAVAALWNLSASLEAKKLIAEADGVATLVDLLRSSHDAHKTSALAALANLAMEKAISTSIASVGAIPAVLELIRDGNEPQKDFGTGLLWVMCVHAENQTVVAEAGAVDQLMKLVRDGTNVQKTRAVAALWNLATDPAISEQIGEAGGVPPLMALLRSGEEDQATYAVGAVAYLTGSSRNRLEAVAAGAISPLVALVRNGSEEQKTKAAAALWNLSGDPANRGVIASAGGVSALVAMLRGGDAIQKLNAASAISSLAEDVDCKPLIVDADGVASLVALAKSGDEREASIAVSALWNFAFKNESATASVTAAGGIEALVRLVESGNDYHRLVASGTLGFLDIDADIKTTVIRNGGVDALFTYLRSVSDGDKEETLVALLGICFGTDESVRLRLATTIERDVVSELKSSSNKRVQELAGLVEAEVWGRAE